MKYAVLGENIKKYRKRHNYTQAQLAEELFVSSQAISNWERAVTPPDLENLCKLAELFRISVDTLIGRNDFSAKRLMIGIDGGGTKTEFVLFSENGEILRRIKLAQSNPNDIGVEECCAVLTEGLDILLEFSPSVCGVFAGIAGATTGDNGQKISAYLGKRYDSVKIKVDTDAVNMISCNAPGTTGMALICGTGSVLFARENGILHRIGGWGYLFDEKGSAYDIGKDAIRSALAQQDGLGEKTIITDMLKEKLKSEMWDCLNMVYQKGKTYIASLAPVVFSAASAGDAVAERIIQKNADHLAQLINTAKKNYHCGNDIIAGGGLIENGKNILLPMIKKSVSSDINFVFPKLPPVYGACIECLRLMDITVEKGFYETFYNDYTSLKNGTSRRMHIC